MVWRVVRAIVLAAAFVLSALCALALHLDFGVTRRSVARLANAALDAAILGDFEIGPIARLRRDEIVVAALTLRDPNGDELARVEGLRLRGAWLEDLGRIALSGRGTLWLDELRIERATLALVPTDDGRYSFVTAFAPRRPPPAAPPPTKAPPSDVGFVIDRLEVGEVHVAGSLGSGVPLDGTLSRLAARIDISSSGVVLDVNRTAVREQKLLGAECRGTLDGHLRAAPADDELPSRLRIWGQFNGHLGTLELMTRASFLDDEVAVTLDLPSVGARDLEPWLAGAPLVAPVAARAAFWGKAPLFELSGAVALPSVDDAPAGELAMRGRLRIEARPLVDATVSLSALNARLFDETLPESKISARARVLALLAGDASEIVAQLESEPSRWDRIALPALAGTILLARAGIEARLRVAESGSPADLALGYRPSPSDPKLRSGAVDFALHAEAGDLRHVERLQEAFGQAAGGLGRLRGRARVSALGRFEGGKLDASADAEVGGLSLPGSRLDVEGARLSARLRGAPDALMVEASGGAVGLKANGRGFERVTLRAHGPVMRPVVHAELEEDGDGTIAATAVVDPLRGEARGVELEVLRGSASLGGRIERIRATPGGVALDGIVLDRLAGGSGRGALRVVNGELSGDFRAENLDLAPLSRLLGLPYPLEGRLDATVDLEPVKGGRRGNVTLTVRDGGVLVVSGVNLDVGVAFDGARMTPRGRLTWNAAPEAPRGVPCHGAIVDVELRDADAALGGKLLDPRSWKELTGSGAIRLHGVKLACLAELAALANPLADLPLGRVQGTLSGSALVERGAPRERVSLRDLSLETRGLVLEAAPDDKGRVAWSSDRLDVELRAALDGESGRSDATLVLLGRGKNAPVRPLATLAARATLDVDALVAGGERAKASLASLWKAPLELALMTPRQPLRAFAVLPSPLRQRLAGIDGDVALAGYLRGSLDDPSLALHAETWKLAQRARSRSEERRRFAIDVDAIATYAGAKGQLSASVERGRRRLATIQGSLRGDLAARMRGEPTPPVEGSVDAELAGLPLAAVPGLTKRGVRGTIHGRVWATGLGALPELHAELDARNLAVGRSASFERFTLGAHSVVGDPNVLVVTSHARERRGGSLDLVAYGAVDWQAGELDLARPAAAYLVANRFPLATLGPALSGMVSKIDGQLSGAMRLSYREILGHKVAIHGTLAIRDAAVHLPSLGQEIYDIDANVASAGSRIVIDDLRGAIGGGEITGNLSADLGDQLELEAVRGSFQIADDAMVPITLQGAPLGHASVRSLRLVTRRERDKLHVVVTATGPSLRVPGSSGADLQPLDEHPDIRVKGAIAPPKPKKRDSCESDTRYTVTLVDAELSGPGLRVKTRTAPKQPLVIGRCGEDLAGQIDLMDGEVLLLGRVFQIDRGFVRLRPDQPDNPYVSATAHWNAPDGSTVYIDFLGPLKPFSRDKIAFRSNPARPQQELLALLLFGDSASGARVGSVTAQTGDQIAAEQVGATLGEIAPGLAPEVGASSGAVTTGVVYQVSERITARANVKQQNEPGAAGGGDTSGRDAATSSTTRVSIDWRFAPNWLLRGSFEWGEAPASGLDLLFQHRYE
jgi:translocation and assembly module TamB